MCGCVGVWICGGVDGRGRQQRSAAAGRRKGGRQTAHGPILQANGAVAAQPSPAPPYPTQRRQRRRTEAVGCLLLICCLLAGRCLCPPLPPPPRPPQRQYDDSQAQAAQHHTCGMYSGGEEGGGALVMVGRCGRGMLAAGWLAECPVAQSTPSQSPVNASSSAVTVVRPPCAPAYRMGCKGRRSRHHSRWMPIVGRRSPRPPRVPPRRRHESSPAQSTSGAAAAAAASDARINTACVGCCPAGSAERRGSILRGRRRQGWG